MSSKKRVFILVFLLVLIGGLFASVPVLATHTGGLVPCGTSAHPEPCDACHFFVLARNILELVLKKLVPAVAVIFIIYGGFVLLTAGGSQERVKSGRKILFNTVIGLAIAYGAFVIVGTVLGALSRQAGGLFLFERGRIVIHCAVPPPPEIVRNRDLCTNFNLLAGHYNNASPRAKNSPELENLLACVQSELTKAGKWGLIDASQTYTWEESREGFTCNFTRGDPICTDSGRCAHTYYSCHYGGVRGTNGAEAVDYNARDDSRAGEEQLFKELEKLKGRCNFGAIIFENNHTHINTKSCDAQRGDR